MNAESGSAEMGRTRHCLLGLLLGLVILWSAGLAHAGPITVELKAVGGYADPHNIQVAPGETVRLVYEMSEVEDLAIFQNSISVDGAIGSIGATRTDTWWGGHSNTSLAFGYQSVTGLYFLFGEVPVGPPWSHSSLDPASLAYFDVVPEGPTVVVDGLAGGHANAVNMWGAADPTTGEYLGPLLVDLAGSNMLVTIHTSDVIPEPMTLTGIAIGLAALVLRRRAVRRSSFQEDV